jgi:tRNA A-37 threonylcarbamoyl transferase component Bud32
MTDLPPMLEPPRAATLLEEVSRDILDRFAEGATLPREHPGVANLTHSLRRLAPIWMIERHLRELSHDGYLRGALVALVADLRPRPRADLALLVARELIDALAPELGLALCRVVLTLPGVEDQRLALGGPYTVANMLLADALLGLGDPAAAIRHYEAVLATDIDHAQALRGWGEATRALERRGLASGPRHRGLALLDGLAELEAAEGLGSDRYELGRPLGRGRHAVVYEAHDRRVGRQVAIKRLLLSGGDKALRARFFAEARTLAEVRSPHVIALLDAQPDHHFIALSLCRGGNLRLALRRGLLSPSDLPKIGEQLCLALAAVHAVGAIHRDIKPANILVRDARPSSPIALADFGLAIPGDPGDSAAQSVGTLRYLAPELRRSRARATSAADIFSAGAVLLELSLAPAPLPPLFDQVNGDLNATALIPPDLPDGWSARLARMLADDPQDRALV